MLGYFIYKLAQILSFILPLKYSYGFGKFVAYFYYLLARNSRRSIIHNLKHAFGEKYSEKEFKFLTINTFQNFAKGLVDFLRFSKIDISYINKYINIKNISFLDEALRKNGVIAITGHIGCWELGGAVLSELGYKFSVVAKTHTRKKVEGFFLKQRKVKGTKVIPVGVAYRRCYKKLLNKEMIVLLIDRRYKEKGLEVTCFNRSVRVPKGPAVLALQTNSAVVPAYLIRKNGCFDFIFEKPIYPEYIKGNTEDERVHNLAQTYINIMEKYIIKYPNQWFLFEKLFG